MVYKFMDRLNNKQTTKKKGDSMRYTITKKSELGTKCWHVNRVMGTCHKCYTLVQCNKRNKLPEARKGLVDSKRIKAEKKYEIAKAAMDDYKRCLEEAKEIQNGYTQS